MQKGFRISYVFLILAVLAFVILGPGFAQWSWGAIIALLGIILGVFYYRRGQ